MRGLDQTIGILVVDDHEVVRLGLASLFRNYSQFRVVGEADCVAKAMQAVEELRPDVVIMDVRLKDGSGIKASRDIMERWPDAKIIILTSYGDEETLLDSIMAGAKGFVLKDVGNEELVRAVGAVGRGESLLDPVITKRLLERMRRSLHEPQDELSFLTKQEKKVLALIALGKTNREIANAIYLSEKTVRNYVSSILSKLSLSNRSEAAVYATRHKVAAE